MRNLWGHWSQIARELEQAPHLLLLFDFDGTLAPIVDRPQAARILPEARRALRQLGGRAGCTLGFVSGRTLADLKKRVGVPSSFYAGNYGLEWEGPGRGVFRAPLAGEVRASLRRVKKLVGDRLGHVPGVWVEDKGHTLSIHYRRVAPLQRGEVRDWLARLARNLDHRLEAQPGKMILEVRPVGGSNKGEIVRRIAEAVQRQEGVVPLVFYFGDDVGDEAAFAVVRQRGYPVRVGQPLRTSRARFYVSEPREVAEFLRRVGNGLAQRRPRRARLARRPKSAGKLRRRG